MVPLLIVLYAAIRPFRGAATGVLGLLCALSCSAWSLDEGPKDLNYTGLVTDPARVCMVKKTVHPTTRYTHEHDGKTYHFCCTMCQTQFKAEPDKLRWAEDPVNGKPVDKAEALIYAYRGRAYFFESKKTLKKFSKKPGKYLSP